MRIVGIIAAVFMALLIIGWIANLFEDKTDCASDAAKAYATVFIKDQARRRLFAPHKADFGRTSAVHYGKGRYSVRGHVDTVNIYGGPLHIYFSGEMQCYPTAKSRRWRAVRFNWNVPPS